MTYPRYTGALCGVLLGVASLGWSATATAQTTAEDIEVIGRYGTVPADVRSLSARVSYADLDLSTEAGKERFRDRVALTARYLCQKLGEPEMTATPPVPSCREAAVSDAMERVRTVETNFKARGRTWVAGPAWQAPYPPEWEKRK